VERLKGSINSKLKAMVRLNRTRMDYLDRFQKMIDEYNAGSMNVDGFFRRLKSFAQGLNEEDQRSIREKLSEEELALFDIPSKPDPGLDDKQKKQVKKVARDLLETLNRGKMVLDWRKFQQSRAAVKVST
jgi:type I restriction enzyme R subunit